MNRKKNLQRTRRGSEVAGEDEFSLEVVDISDVKFFGKSRPRSRSRPSSATGKQINLLKLRIPEDDTNESQTKSRTRSKARGPSTRQRSFFSSESSSTSTRRQHIRLHLLQFGFLIMTSILVMQMKHLMYQLV